MKAALIGLALALTTTAALAGLDGATPQRGGGGRFQEGPPVEYQGNTPYDGRFVFIRLRYNYGFGGFRSRGGPPWSDGQGGAVRNCGAGHPGAGGRVGRRRRCVH